MTAKTDTTTPPAMATTNPAAAPRSARMRRGAADAMTAPEAAREAANASPAIEDGQSLTVACVGVAASGAAETSTTAGRAAPCTAAEASATSAFAPAAPRVTRRSQLCALLARPEGADLATLCAHFGWQPHSARAALSGLRKAGLAVERRVVAGPAKGEAAEVAAPAATARYHLVASPAVPA